MPELESTSYSQDENSSTINPVDHRPLYLLRSEYIPPAPTRSTSTIDWLPEFAGYSWAAYGASSLLVISHIPSPFSKEETVLGPLFRQVFELSDDYSSAITAVSWSPATPSTGELASASQNRISVFIHDSESSKGSFCWRQNAVLVQSTAVEAIDWTGSGDGIIAVGVEVVFWKKKTNSWEIAWKYKESLHQNLVSATWSIDGPSATATYTSEQNFGGSNETGKCVFVFLMDGKSEHLKLELRHPQPISMIQWRPSTRRQFLGDLQHRQKHVLLTCCFDGTVRLWSEMDNARVRKIDKDNNDPKNTRLSFCVSATIEINQSLNGVLGVNVHFTWATEIRGTLEIDKEIDELTSTRGYEPVRAGNCEWLIGFGPEMLVTYWAVHCLDDISPLRFPRVTLWKKQSLEPGNLHRLAFSSFKERLLLNKVVISRNNLYGPPTICSLMHLSPCNFLVWSSLCTQLSDNIKESFLTEGQKGNFLSYQNNGALNTDGHIGKILQFAIHPYISEVELAVSLDSNGLLLFWSLSTVSNCFPGFPILNPMWKLCGRFGTQGSCSKYTSLCWAPTVLDEEKILLMGHVGGIDCFIVKISQTEGDDIVCYYICTLPFTGHGPYDDGPNDIFSLPLPSFSKKNIKYNKFMLLAVWIQGFEALSWEVTLHSFNLSERCCKPNDNNDDIDCCMWRFENTFSNKRYCLLVNPGSSQFPEPRNLNQVTSFAVVCLSSLTPTAHQLGYGNDLRSIVPKYTMATGFSDGCLKLWRSNFGQASTPCILWELVGMFTAHQGPITAMGLTDCGRKIATVCPARDSNAVCTICIWESVYLTGLGSFVLEDTLSFDRNVVSVKWLALENGQFLLGACTANELRIYAQKHCRLQTISKASNSLDMQLWFCIGYSHTSPVISDFFWGRKATAIVVHHSYFSLLGQLLFLLDEKRQSKCQSNFIMDNSTFESVMHKKNDHLSSSLLVENDQLKRGSALMLGFWSILDIAEKLSEPLPIYQPAALLMNICSGNWKRAYVSLRHLTEYLTSSNRSEKAYYCAKSSYNVPQILLSDYFEGLLSKGSAGNETQWSGVNTSMSTFAQFNGDFGQFAYNIEPDAFKCDSSSPNSELDGFIDSLEKSCGLAAISNSEKTEILAVVDLLKEVSNMNSTSAYQNLDEPGRRFWVALRFQQLYHFRRFGRLSSVEELVVDSGLISWAFHSDCQEALISSFLPNEPSWPEMRTLGLGFWFTNATQLRSRMEKLARLQYLKKKDPKDCALLYVALGRLQVLAGLFKISRDEKDKPLVAFLSRNFQEEKNKAAALKNAYVLLGRHQLELAIAFFLLGGDTASAINICVKNLGDEQLALVICHLVEGHGGPLERHIIAKTILPSAIDRGDYWLTSLLEWQQGNYSESFKAMHGFDVTSASNKFVSSSNNAAFMDPDIGSYCLRLANNNSMRNAIGERNAAILGRWATLMRATALNRCGLPLEALECLSSSPNPPGNADQRSISNGNYQILHGILKPFVSDSWLEGDVAFHLESQTKLDLALQYLSKLTREHPSWLDLTSDSNSTSSTDFEIHLYMKLLENFQDKLYRGLAHCEQRFLLDSPCLISKVLVFLCNNGFLFMGSDILRGYASHAHTQHESSVVDKFLLDSLQHKSLLKGSEDVSISLSRFIAASSIAFSHFRPSFDEIDPSSEGRSRCVNAWGYYFQHVISSLWNLRAAMRSSSGVFIEDIVSEPLCLLDLYEYCVYFASAWLHKDSKGLLLMAQPLLITYTNGHTPYEIDMVKLKKVFREVAQSVALHKAIDNVEEDSQVPIFVKDKQSGDTMCSIPEDERWKVMGACLWQHMLRFIKHKLNSLSIRLDDNHLPGISQWAYSSSASSLTNSESASISTPEHIKLYSIILAKPLRSTLSHILSYHVKQLVSFLQQKVEYGYEIPTHRWLGESCAQPKVLHQHLNLDVLSSGVVNNKDEAAISELLWNVCADANLLSLCFAEEKVNWERCVTCKPSKGWSNMNESVTVPHELEVINNNEGRSSSTLATGATASPSRGLFRSSHSFLSSWQKDPNVANEITPFQTPKEICKRHGELLEALCINSIDQSQAALASDRKGIVFINWEDKKTFRDQSEYIWSDVDWPQNGWAGLESTPVPTPVSPGIGLGISKGAHLGLGGATTGVGSFVRPGKDFSSSGSFGIPGYAVAGASGLGWEIQDEYEEFVDPPATVGNISTRAFSSHPSRPFFLVGSSNTHIYLWEFGKDIATATYGVLPAANVPPPYALASISALHFDYCGHRFASAALDGTVCTWQLEVGGRSNVRPTESYLCFNSHASDVTYMTSSGSIIAAAGHSSNGVNVVIWDTLAPPTNSRASILCHEGGARSISVFDNNIGSGPVSPYIVTGGKGGDVAVHDFRYVAAGKGKKHRHLGKSESSISSSPNVDTQKGVENKLGEQNGMVWYIPKAHLGSVTRISTIPNTSLFLTGSKDGDVKLWDAKAAKLVYHWSKLHERHTFLQPNSRGFGGVVRAAVTDIQVIWNGFLTCGGDGLVKLIQLKDYQQHSKGGG